MTSRVLEVSLNNPRCGAKPAAGAQGCAIAARRGFSLSEMLVVIGVLVILAGLTVAVVSKAKNAADKAKVKSDLMAIGSALDQYANDFKGVYPMANLDLGNGRATGEHVLAKALIGPGPAENSKNPHFADGYDGPGFRAMRGGRVYPPYLAPEKFKVADPDESGTGYWEILDSYNAPIAYLPKRNSGVRAEAGPVWAKPKDKGKPMYDPLDVGNSADLAAAIGAMLGDDNGDARIRTPETLRHSGPFILISPGPDMLLHSDSSTVKNSDDVYNFDR